MKNGVSGWITSDIFSGEKSKPLNIFTTKETASLNVSARKITNPTVTVMIV